MEQEPCVRDLLAGSVDSAGEPGDGIVNHRRGRQSEWQCFFCPAERPEDLYRNFAKCFTGTDAMCCMCLLFTSINLGIAYVALSGWRFISFLWRRFKLFIRFKFIVFFFFVFFFCFVLFFFFFFVCKHRFALIRARYCWLRRFQGKIVETSGSIIKHKWLKSILTSLFFQNDTNVIYPQSNIDFQNEQKRSNTFNHPFTNTTVSSHMRSFFIFRIWKHSLFKWVEERSFKGIRNSIWKRDKLKLKAKKKKRKRIS